MNSLMSSWILWSPNHMNIWIGKCRFLQALGSCRCHIDVVLWPSYSFLGRCQIDRQRIAKWSQNNVEILHQNDTLQSPHLKPWPCQHQNRQATNTEILEEFDFSSTETKRNISKDRWPSENDIKTHRCYNSFCAINLVTIDLRSICIKASDGFHVVSIKKNSNMFPVSTPDDCMASSLMEYPRRFHGELM